MNNQLKLNTIADILQQPPATELAGREAELDQLMQFSRGNQPLVLFLYAIPGMGKTALMNCFLAQVLDEGGSVLHIDANRIEPTPGAFRQEIGQQLGCQVEEIATTLSGLPGPVVLAVDNYQSLRILETWLRDRFLPQLPGNVRVLLAGNQRSGSGWYRRAPWDQLFQLLELGPIAPRDCVSHLLRQNFSIVQAQFLQRITQGFPLALSLACSLSHGQEDGREVARILPRLMTELAEVYLENIADSQLAALVKELSPLRTFTLPLLQALRPDQEPAGLYSQLKSLTFIEEASDGLHMHESVKQALVTKLNAEHPQRLREVKRIAWALLDREVRQPQRQNLWRYTADLIYLLDDPVIREAFFPQSMPFYDLCPAAAEHWSDIKQISELHVSGNEQGMIRLWWQLSRSSFHMVLDRQGEVAGFYIAADPAQCDSGLLQRDSMARQWLQAFRQSRISSSQRALFIRRWLCRESGDAPSAVQAAAWLDLKRTYLEMRPHLRQVYLAVSDLAPYADVATRLGFAVQEQLAVPGLYGACLDMGPGSVSGWLHDLLAHELGITERDFLDPSQQGVRLEGRSIALTHLEYQVIAQLYSHVGTPVTREKLLQTVWGTDYQGGSNVVDAVITNLRRKLAPQGDLIHTVRGLGYALRLPEFS